MTAKDVFTDLTTDLIIAMCRDIAFDQSGVIAKSTIANIQVVKNTFSNVTVPSNAVDLNCGSNCTVPTKVVLGSQLESMYNSWACGSENCSG